MRKHIFILILFLLVSCEKNDYCYWDLTERYPEMTFFENGELFSNNPTYWTMGLILDPKDWDHNLYFTGIGFEKGKENAFKAQDTCELKNKLCWAFGWNPPPPPKPN